MKISVETLPLAKRFGDKEAIRILAQAGFECIDYSMMQMGDENSPLNQPDYREYARFLRTYGESLGVTFNQGHAPYVFDWNKENVFDDVVIPLVSKSLEIASIMGIDTVVVHPFQYPTYFHHIDLIWEKNLEYYSKLLPYAQKYGVRIALENVFKLDARNIAVPGACADPDRYVKAIDTLNDPHIVACVDVGHACLVGDDPTKLIYALGHDRLKALHIHDNNAVTDEHLMPYLGKIDWGAVAKALADIDYDGVFTFETFRFFEKFEDDFLPTVAGWVYDMGKYLVNKIECYKREDEYSGPGGPAVR